MEEVIFMYLLLRNWGSNILRWRPVYGNMHLNISYRENRTMRMLTHAKVQNHYCPMGKWSGFHSRNLWLPIHPRLWIGSNWHQQQIIVKNIFITMYIKKWENFELFICHKHSCDLHIFFCKNCMWRLGFYVTKKQIAGSNTKNPMQKLQEQICDEKMQIFF